MINHFCKCAILDLDAMLANRSELFVQLAGNGLLELKDLVLKAPALIAFVLQRSSVHQRWSGAEWSVHASLPHWGRLSPPSFTRQIAALRARIRSTFTSVETQAPCGAFYAGLVTDAFLLPQVILNAISRSSANAISPWFYVGGTVIGVAPHMYDVARARRYVLSVRPSYLYASTSDGLFGSVAWDAAVTCGAA
jgi:hypothetical protein